ncbi:hypothetical protein DFJ73DRAFT_823950 [Zopfochytrium polystomum]|nr:hypothetical protein DFJ73DRAFT_823950 [Zopfochytrium polystomum]
MTDSVKRSAYAAITSIPPTHTHKILHVTSSATSYYLQVSKTWDRGNRSIREKILQEFVDNNANKTGPQLERELGNGASLFLTRISAWLRLTYLLGYNISLQLRAISIFISAASGHRFLAEFLEIGGVLTVLELLGLSQIKEADKAEALRLLLHVAHAGRKYKEFLCESYGVRAVADCLARSKSEVTQDYCQNLLHQLGTGNPKFLMQVYKSLLSLLTSPSSSPTAQQMVGQALRMLLPSVQLIHVSIVDATLSLLKSPHIQIQYEGYEMLRELVQRPNLQDAILTQLINILKTQVDDSAEEVNDDRRRRAQKGEGKTLTANQWNGITIQDDKPWDGTLSIYIQQAYAAKLLGVIAATNMELAERMIQLQVVCGLLNTVANVAHPESQRYAANTMLDKPDTFFRELTWEQVRYLRKNTVRVTAYERNEDEKDRDSNASGSSDDDGSLGSSRPTTGGRHRASTGSTAFPTSRGAHEKQDSDTIAPTDKPEAPSAAQQVDQTKAQKDAIISEYEKMKDPNEEHLVEEMYEPYGHASSNTTFSLERFRSTNSRKVQRENEELMVAFNDSLRDTMQNALTRSFSDRQTEEK